MTEDQLALWKLEALEAAGLSPALASRLNGSTREAIFTDARMLASQAQPEPSPTAEAQALARMAIRNARKAEAVGLAGGRLSPAPNELAERQHGERLVPDDN